MLATTTNPPAQTKKFVFGTTWRAKGELYERQLLFALQWLDSGRSYEKCGVLQSGERRDTMAIRNLTDWNDPIFLKKSRKVEKFDERLWILLDDMADTLEHVCGYGCAAVHVGILRSVVVVLDKDGLIELVNPEITEESTEMQKVLEGSIAYGAPRGYVMRPSSITVAGFDRHGTPITVQGVGFLAATLCHEIDHTNGILFSDKIVEPEKLG